MQKYLEKETASVSVQTIECLQEQLMDEYGDDIVRLVYTYVKNAAIAEDLAQEIFIKCFRALPNFKGDSSYRTWLYKIAINHCKDFKKSWYAKNVQLHDFGEMEYMEEGLLEEEVMKRAEVTMIRQAVDELPDKLRILVHLHYFEGNATREIAELLTVNENTVKSRLRKARQQLEKKLRGKIAWTND